MRTVIGLLVVGGILLMWGLVIVEMFQTVRKKGAGK